MKTRLLTKAILPYLDRPYSLGCKEDGLDCLGLLWVVFEDLGINLPRKYKGFTADNYAQKWATGKGKEELIEYLLSLGKEIDLNYINPGDIILSDTGFGIYLGNGNKVTVIEGHSVMVIPVSITVIKKAIRVT